MRDAGYQTGVIGKWHLGLGESVDKNWNSAIKPGPLEVGFDYSFIFPATADRVPTVFIENYQVVGLEPDDPIHVSYTEKIGNEPTGRENPELLKMPSSPNHGHDNTIINGIGRIGFMEGGQKARWVDEELSLTFLSKAKNFIEENKSDPFFLFFALTEPHVPRMPATMFKGQSKLGYRGDAIKQMDWTVGEIIGEFEKLKLDDNTVVIFTSDNGPVLDDGYVDGAVEQFNGHKPAGALRGGKYSIFEAGTRMPWIVWGKGVEKNKVSEALISQVDLLASLAELVDSVRPKEARDSKAMSKVLLGTADEGREYVIQHAGALAIRKGDWKYIAPSSGRAYNKLTDIELGNLPEDQLYNLSEDPGETRNLANQYPEIVRELKFLLEKEKND